MDIRALRIKNKLPFEGSRHSIVESSSRLQPSLSSSQHILHPISTSSPRSTSSYDQSRQSTEVDFDTLFEIDETQLEQVEMSFSRSLATKRFKKFMSGSSTDHSVRSDKTRSGSRNDNLLSGSPSQYNNDAAGEPLVNDAASDYIPKSARPLIYGDNSNNDQHQTESQQLLQTSLDRPASPPRPSSRSRADLEHYLPIHRTKTPESSRHRVESVTAKQEKPSLPMNTGTLPNIERGKQSRGSHESVSTTVSRRPASSIESVMSNETDQSSYNQGLVPLQARSVFEEGDRLQPVLEDDPASFNLLSPSGEERKGFNLERRAQEMLSGAHLQEIFAEPSTMLKFTRFLSQHRPQSVPLLIYYLNAMKSIKAIKYANAVAESLRPIDDLDFTTKVVETTVNTALEIRAREAFDTITREDLPAYCAHAFIQTVNLSLRARVTGVMPAHLRDASEGLAEVFCLTDPSRRDNPIVFSSEEFHRTTQYGVDYALGRNCRFLQGPGTDRNSVRRLKAACDAGRECVEVFLNYRRDGSPFMNLLMVAPLIDSRGTTRYFIGAQVDVTGLVKDCTDLEGLRRLVEKKKSTESEAQEETDLSRKKSAGASEFVELSEMLNEVELDAVRRHGGRMNPEKDDADSTIMHHRPRMHIREPSAEEKDEPDAVSHYPAPTKGRLLHVYQNYLLVRPAPSLRILFASPALRTPGMLQSAFLSRIGGSQRVREELEAALGTGRGVTAKIRWISGRNPDEDGRPRWVHCTPLLGQNGSIGVWMIVIVDEENAAPSKRFKSAPPVSDSINGKERDRLSSRYGGSFNGSLESLGLTGFNGPPSEFGDDGSKLHLEDM